MAGNGNLTLALRIQADLKQAQDALKQLDSTLGSVNQSAQSTSRTTGSAGNALDGMQGAAGRAADQTNRYSVAADQAARRSAAASQGIDQVSRSADQSNPALDRLTRRVTAIAGSFLGLQAASRAITMVDDYGQMASRIEQVTRSTAEYEQVQARLRDSANDTYRPLQEAQELYIRTAEALRSLGYETTATLDITDSFSLLLVTNAASADRAASAIDAYSKAIQTGRVSSDQWQSMIAAMPTVVNAIAEATGKSAEEIRRLGIEGKLALQDLNEGLRQSLEENRQAAEDMPTTVADAYVKLGNALQVYLGEANRSTEMTQALAWAITQLGENIELIGNVLGVVAAGALARYITSLGLSTKAAIADTLAKRAAAAEELRLAQAQAASTASALASARAQQGLTVSHTQVAAAAAAHEAATRRLVAAQAAMRGVTSLLGGPAGIVMLAASAAASFFLFRDSSDALASSLGNLDEPLDAVLGRLQQLSEIEQKAQMQGLADQIDGLRGEAHSAAQEIRETIAQALYGPRLDRVPSRELEQAFAPLMEAAGKAAQGIEVDWQAAMDALRNASGVPERLSRQVLDMAANQARASREATEMKARHDELAAALDNSTRAINDGNNALKTNSKEAEDYLQRLRRQTEDLLDPSIRGRVERDIRDREELRNATDELKQAALEEAAAQDAANEARRRARPGRQAVSEAEREAKAIEGYVKQLERQAATFGMTAAQVRNYELAERGLSGAMLARAQSALTVLESSEKERQVAQDLIELDQIRAELLRAQGREAEALTIEIEQRYGELMTRLQERGDTAGLEIVNGLINIEQARARLNELQSVVDQVFSSTARQEQSVQAQLAAGLITEGEARRRIIELHQQQAAEVERLLPQMEELARTTGDPAALENVQRIRAELENMQYITNDLIRAFRDGLQGGIEEALMGLVRGTHDLRDALESLVLGIADSMARLAAEQLADMATQSVLNLFGSGADAAADAAGATATATAITTATTAGATAMGTGITTGGTAAASAMGAAITTAGASAAAAMASAIAGASAGNALGGAYTGAFGFAGGGQIRGPGTNTSDSIPIWASDEEFMTRAAVVKQPGALDFLEDFNARGMSALDEWAMSRWYRHSTGGLVGVPAPSLPSPGLSGTSLAEPAKMSTNLKNSVNLYAVQRPEDVAAMAWGKAGQEHFMVYLQQHGAEVRQLLGF
ncbi:tape measure protein [Pseudomonas jilinensis]|uniref:Tail length tape measure protein n=1 Tax=Pseudomonas jilinensis TaxID=2078689 RepID=A0A396S6X5_9PSED|nr:tape measure protein [Pseudomonas jilinensis]RHW21881.1 tail length tape measure protein [Pseudomonas jilinensis]